MSLSAWLIFLSIWCVGKKNLHTDHEKKILSSKKIPAH
jgi:hypothetical protein